MTTSGAHLPGVGPSGGLSRRAVLGLAAWVASPAIVRSSALASSGELNLVGWSGYNFESLLAAFTGATGIKVNFADQPDNESMRAEAARALSTGGIDMLEPSLDLIPAWIANGLVRPWDMSRASLDGYETAFVTGRAGEIAERDGQRYFLPSVWGTEALTRSNEDPTNPASLADLFEPRYRGKVTLRAHSALAALGRVMDGQGRLPRPFMDSYRDPDTMRAVWDVIVAEAIRRKANVAQFWSNENQVQAAFRAQGCELGLTWDSTAFSLGKDGLPFTFVAPREGAFAWLQGYVLHARAANVEQATAFANFVATPEGSALNATAFSANPTGRGGIDKMDALVSRFYRAAYPGDALAKLWWWPVQEAWFLKARNDYAERWQKA